MNLIFSFVPSICSQKVSHLKKTHTLNLKAGALIISHVIKWTFIYFNCNLSICYVNWVTSTLLLYTLYNSNIKTKTKKIYNNWEAKARPSCLLVNK